MSSPSFENIDQWLFEFTEGNLSVSQTNQLMEFISRNPELIEELTLWQNAKVSQKDVPEFNSKSLQKSTPFLFLPTTLAVFGVSLLFLVLIGFFLFPSKPIYSFATIDTDIIRAKDFFDLQEQQQNISMNTNKIAVSSPVLSSENILDEVSKNTEIQVYNQLEKQENKNTLKSDLSPRMAFNTSDNFPQTVSKSTINSTLLVNKTANALQKGEAEIVVLDNDDAFSHIYQETEGFSSQDLDLRKEIALEDKKTQVKAENLSEVIAYLDGKTVEKETYDKQFEKKSPRIISGAEVAKTTFKKSFHNISRKIEKMINQPLALRNTKNPHFHVPMLNGYAANSAMVGTAGGNRIQATSRLQWANQKNEQMMNSVSWDGYIYPFRGGLGIDVDYTNYSSGAINNYSVGITYSPKFSINNNVSFEPALSLKMGVVEIDKKSSLIGNKIEMNRNNLVDFFAENQVINGKQLWYRDAGLGMMLNTKIFYVGVEADNLGRHYNNYYSNDLNKEYRENIHYSAIFGTEYQPMNYKFVLNGYAYFQNYGSLNELWLGGNFKYNWFQLGVGVNNNLDFAGSIAFNIKNFSIYYNADFIESKMLNKQYLSHQISLKLLMKPNRHSTRFFNL